MRNYITVNELKFLRGLFLVSGHHKVDFGLKTIPCGRWLIIGVDNWGNYPAIKPSWWKGS